MIEVEENGEQVIRVRWKDLIKDARTLKLLLVNSIIVSIKYLHRSSIICQLLNSFVI